MEILNNNHQYTIIASINKIYNFARINGILKPKELYLLDIIYKLLNNYNILSKEQINKLIILYTNILNSSDLLCKDNNIKNYYYGNSNFHIAIPNTAPEIDDPDPVDPTPVDPVIIPGCDGNSYQIFDNMDFVTMSGNSFVKCLETTTTILYAIKIVKLPNKGILTLSGNNVIVGQVILFDGGFPNEFINPYDLVYTPFIDRGNNEVDFIEYQVIIDNSPETLTEIVNLEITIL